MTFPSARFIPVQNGQLALYEAGPKDGPLILCIHGWPDIAHSWAGPMKALAKAGFRVIAMDVRGFGQSLNPEDIKAYSIDTLVDDVRRVIEEAERETAILLGHDWGGIICWHAARMISDRISHIMSLCTPHVKRAPIDPIEIFRARYGDEHYIVHFNDRPGEADALFASDPEGFVDMIFQPPHPVTDTAPLLNIPARFKEFISSPPSERPTSLLSDNDKVAYTDGFKRSGFHGGLNLYRNMSDNWHRAAELPEMIEQPCLVISGELDIFLPPAFTDQMVPLAPQLERHIIKDCGHWLMLEAPEQVNTLLVDWLKRQNCL